MDRRGYMSWNWTQKRGGQTKAVLASQISMRRLNWQKAITERQWGLLEAIGRG